MGSQFHVLTLPADVVGVLLHQVHLLVGQALGVARQELAVHVFITCFAVSLSWIFSDFCERTVGLRQGTDAMR